MQGISRRLSIQSSVTLLSTSKVIYAVFESRIYSFKKLKKVVNWVVQWTTAYNCICLRATTLLTLQFNLISFACVVKSYTSQWPFRPFTLFCVFLHTLGAAWAHISAFYSKTTRQVYGAMKFCVPLSPFFLLEQSCTYIIHTWLLFMHANFSSARAEIQQTR